MINPNTLHSMIYHLFFTYCIIVGVVHELISAAWLLLPAAIWTITVLHFRKLKKHHKRITWVVETPKQRKARFFLLLSVLVQCIIFVQMVHPLDNVDDIKSIKHTMKEFAASDELWGALIIMPDCVVDIAKTGSDTVELSGEVIALLNEAIAARDAGLGTESYQDRIYALSDKVTYLEDFTVDNANQGMLLASLLVLSRILCFISEEMYTGSIRRRIIFRRRLKYVL